MNTLSRNLNRYTTYCVPISHKLYARSKCGRFKTWLWKCFMETEFGCSIQNDWIYIWVRFKTVCPSMIFSLFPLFQSFGSQILPDTFILSVMLITSKASSHKSKCGTIRLGNQNQKFAHSYHGIQLCTTCNWCTYL